MDNKVSAHAIVSGRVQGVFFRMETKHVADKYSVFGWVRNRRDGTVEAVFEGDKESVEAVLEWCHDGPPHAVVSAVDVEWQDYSGEFDRFEITY